MLFDDSIHVKDLFHEFRFFLCAFDFNLQITGAANLDQHAFRPWQRAVDLFDSRIVSSVQAVGYS